MTKTEYTTSLACMTLVGVSCFFAGKASTLDQEPTEPKPAPVLEYVELPKPPIPIMPVYFVPDEDGKPQIRGSF